MTIKGVIVSVYEDGKVNVLCSNDKLGISMSTENLAKTGKHYESIKRVIEELQSEEE